MVIGKGRARIWAAVCLTLTLAACAGTSPPIPPPTPRPPPAPAPAPAPPPAPVPPPAPPQPPPAPVSEKVTLAADVFFDAGLAVLKPAAKLKLDEVVAKVTGISLEVIIAVGHTDSTGSVAVQQRLSQERANAVRGYFIAKGVESNRTYSEGKGAAQPVADNVTAAGRARNNRVEIEVVGTRQSDGPNPASWKPNDQVPVLFATNRQPTGSDNPFHFYGNALIDRPDRNNLRRGIAVVRVPPDRQRGEVSRTGWVAVTLERVTSLPLAKGMGITPRPASDPRTDFSFAQPIAELPAGEFARSLNQAVSRSKSKTAVLYVHGYANDFADAAFRTAQIAFDLAQPDYDLVPLMFSWPSDPGGTGMNYGEARKRSEASGYDLARLLEEVAAATDIGTVHLIAHSMGSEVLGHAMLKLGVHLMGINLGDLKYLFFGLALVVLMIFRPQGLFPVRQRLLAYGTSARRLLRNADDSKAAA